MNHMDFDLFVIGAGSGGVRASRIAAQLGAKVAVAENRYLGGTCVNVGCVPKKLMVQAAQYAEDFVDAAGFGWTVGERDFNWTTFIGRKDHEIQRLNQIYGNLLEGAGVTLVQGQARFIDAQTVQVGDQQYTAKHILIATGSWPYTPEFPGAEHTITSNEIFHLPEQPQRVLIVGGGYIAVEFAGILHGMGSQVTQIYRGDLFLRGFDQDLRCALRDAMRSKPIDLRFNTNIAGITKTETGLHVTLTDGSEQEVDCVLMATGRKPLIDGLGLDQVGVALSETGSIAVDAYSKTNIDSIYAIGDVTDRMNLTPVALHEGTCLAHTLYGDQPMSPTYDNVASAVFSQPPCASCGLTEEEAREDFDVAIYRSTFKPMKNTLSGRDEKSMMKLIVDKKTDRVLGFHMVGPDAGEMMQGLAVAMKCGVTKKQLDATIGIHPTAAEEWVTMRTPVEQ